MYDPGGDAKQVHMYSDCFRAIEKNGAQISHSFAHKNCILPHPMRSVMELILNVVQ